MEYLTPSVITLLLSIIYFYDFGQQNRFSRHRWLITDTIAEEYDYVIVGGGPAGSVVAARLSEDKTKKVLILEAGGFYDESPAFHSLTDWVDLQQTKHDWAYYTAPQTQSCLGMKENRAYWPRGRVLGGSGMMNAALYARGSRFDYDDWAANGCKGWSYSDVLPYFLKSEDLKIEELKSSRYHRKDGLLAVSSASVTPFADIFMRAGNELGYNTTDYNGKNQEGFSKVQINARGGIRDSAANGFLTRAGKKLNFDIVVNTHVTKIEIQGNVAKGVHFIQNGKKGFVKARKEVIVSAGAINSPQLLMLSGIGPKAHLKELNIPLIADLPVGNNLQDHVSIWMFNTINQSVSITPSKLTNQWTRWQHRFFGTGLLSTTGAEGLAFLYTDDKSHGKSSPDIQFILDSMLFKVDHCNFKDSIQKEYADWGDETEGFTTVLSNTRPKSRGTVRLRSSDPSDKPILDPQYLSDPYDVQNLIAGIRIWEKFIETPTIKALGASVDKMKLSFCSKHDFRSDAYWECVLRHLAVTLYHPSCTCKMGAADDPTAVLDSELRVKGVKGLRVVDASAFPNIPSGNIHAPVVMLAEKAADMILGIDSVKDLRQNLPDDI